jgi:hypothetical protein
MFSWCFCGVVSVVSKRHEETFFFGKNGAHINTNLASTEMRNVAIGVVCRLNFVNMIFLFWVSSRALASPCQNWFSGCVTQPGVRHKVRVQLVMFSL